MDIQLRTFALRLCLLAALLASLAGAASAQGNYEIQVYGADTVEARTTMVEVHSNFTPVGQKATINGVYPTNHQQHETLELTQGINDWSEVGFYVFTSLQDGHGYQWVGDHLRPRVRVPTAWHWPVGVSLSTEIGYQRAVYSPDTWTWEIRPIVDKQLGRWYMAFNPALERTLHGPDVTKGLDFAPAAKIGYDFTKKINAGFEYYADYGDLRAIDALHDQQQQLFLVTDLNVSPKWEINFGVGVGGTSATDHILVKGILGRHFSWGHQPPAE
ncbi:MAG: hypothetical protein KGK08_12605 [Acidobacteriota bacterium]|nr:hypothetical protein [Acidobacteriota bacterium]